jgi:hypothetical protein
MTLILTIHDKNGTELKFGDIVKIEVNTSGSHYTFYSEVKYLPESKSIAPFHTFAFHGFEKVDKLPDNVDQLEEPRYRCWMHKHDESEDDAPQKEAYSKYLMEWRECEHLLAEKIFQIHIGEENKYIKGTQLSLI